MNYNKAIQIYKKLGKEDSLEIADVINEVGLVYYNKSEFKEARSKYK
jgi:hypothetical protein